MADKKEELSILKQSRTNYPESPDEAKLETFENPSPENNYIIELESSEFTSLCPVTSQPDYGNIIINYIPGKRCIESKSLKLYLFSYRNYQGFAEKIINRILNDIVRASCPKQVKVTGFFKARGGITIKVESNYIEEGSNK
ncbi:preQ(1) synthase [Elusimicrobiota bacterium]